MNPLFKPSSFRALRQSSLQHRSPRMITQYAFHTPSLVTQDKHKGSHSSSWNLYWGSAILGAGIGIGLLLSDPFQAQEKQGPSYKEQLFGKYENRIREMSAPEKIFEYFASIKTGTGSTKESFMTPADFVRAITPYNYSQNADVGLNGSKFNKDSDLLESVKHIMKVIDQNGDGMISFSEFIFFTSLLSIPPKYFQVAFNIYDEDGSGSLDISEFKSAMRLIRQSNPLAGAQRSESEEAIDAAGIYTSFFGEDGKNQLSFSQFKKFLTDLRGAVLRLQFEMLSDRTDGKISARDFAMDLVSYGNFRNMDDYLQRVEKLEDNPTRISFSSFKAFNDVLESLDEINFTLSSFVSMGEPFSKKQLQRAAQAVSGVELADDLLEIVFSLFDKNGDGRLDYQEFGGVLSGRQTFGFSKPRDSGFVRFTKCMKSCWEEELYARA